MAKRILVTSALPYVNNVPHLGTLVCVLSADVYTRFLRGTGKDVISVLGTDEHGTTSETKALEEGVSPRQLVDKYFKIHKETYDWFLCDFDCFGRTSSLENSEITKDIFLKLNKNGYILLDIIDQQFCTHCKKFLPDRFVEGTCPVCGDEGARGDQCDACGNLINAHELKNPKCKVCGNEPIVRKTKHLFIDLPKLEPKLREWIESVSKNWSPNAKIATESWLKEGLRPRAITRDLKWGIQVPMKEYADKVFYSWFDAPIGYIGITKECKEDWFNIWHSPKDTRLVQFMGKDNIPFHTILFPSFLIGAHDDYTLLHTMSSNEYLQYQGGKFSKSRGTGVFGDDAKETGIAPDVWRYYIMVNRPENADTEFSWEDFQSKLNNELVGNLGNLVYRTISFVNRFCEGELVKVKLDKREKELWENVKSAEAEVTELLDGIKLKDALKKIMHISRLGNQFFQESEPWKAIKEDESSTKSKLALVINLIKDLSILLEPYMPNAVKNIRNQLDIEKKDWSDLGKISIEKGHKVGKERILFEKLEDDKRKEFEIKYSGQQKDKSADDKSGDEDENTFPLNIKVAEVKEVKDHPNADKLYVLQIDLGSEKRQIVAGLKAHYEKEELIGKHICVLTNLKPAKLRGEESNGMLLAATDDEGVVKALLAPKSSPGDQVYADDLEINENIITYDDFSKVELFSWKKKVTFGKIILKTDNEEIIADIKDCSRVG